ncbi:MAG TPA: TRCF domain-containing protein, partial [Devosia sp.]
DGLRSGDIRVVIATHAIAAEDVELPELGLVIIDEEQRFGAKLKGQLEQLAKGVHLLAMSATPIPRTLQAAMVGLQDVSVLATPPARRRPVRTFLTPYDAASARTALLREQRRGGQSFVVVPRIEDIDKLADELKRIVPELSIAIAHGDLGPKQIDTALMQFANGAGDILLATNIIESGLDVPRANTMLIWRADRFGLSQLHQLRGRVGRGRAQGFAYLLTDPDEEIADATRTRLATLETMDRLGSGFQIAARDLELRGAGDLLGEDQAGHVHLIGAGLYQQLLERALAAVKGEPLETITPTQINAGLPAFIPSDYVPEAVVRINLYARLQRITKMPDIDDFADELEDRFGEHPPELQTLLAFTRLGLQAGKLDIDRIDAGPKAIAVAPRIKSAAKKLIGLSGNRLHPSNDRLTAERDGSDDVLAELRRLLGN